MSSKESPAAVLSNKRKRYQIEINVPAIRKALDSRPAAQVENTITDPCQDGDPHLSVQDKASFQPPPALEPGVPALRTYYMYLTEGCNLACQHCWVKPTYTQDKGTGGHVELNRLLKACEDAKPLGLSQVKLTGGEPLLYPDFVDLVYALKKMGLRIWMETNLTLLTPENANATLDTMKFISTSLDSATEEGHDTFRGVKGGFRATCEAIKLLSPHINLQVIMSVHSGNADEIEDLIKLSKDLGARSVKFNLIQMVGRANIMKRDGRVLDIHELIRLGNLVERQLTEKYNMPLIWSWPSAFASIKDLTKGKHRGMCGIHNILGVLGSGHYALCGIGQTVEELVYGSLDDDIVDIWNHNEMLKRLRTELPAELRGICGDCIHKRGCKAHCVANNYYESNSLKESNWFCAEAHRAGLFPESRMVAPYLAQPV
ncbi:MAG TPA: radical SAM protein [Candidatus Brocadiia bacterium]|nr:radical SAM protein [Candidatus Brocadiales bacterium]